MGHAVHEPMYLGFMDIVHLHIVPSGLHHMEVHTHGLELYKHMNLAVTAPRMFVWSARDLLVSLSDAIMHDNALFTTKKVYGWDEWGEFSLKHDSDMSGQHVLRVHQQPLEEDESG